MKSVYITTIIIVCIIAGIILAVKDRPDSNEPIPLRNDTVGEIILE